jgi:hypothetical protein
MKENSWLCPITQICDQIKNYQDPIEGFEKVVHSISSLEELNELTLRRIDTCRAFNSTYCEIRRLGLRTLELSIQGMVESVVKILETEDTDNQGTN